MSYGGNPAHSLADQLRYEIGDRDPAKPILTDGEVEFLLAQYGNNVLLAAIAAAQNLLVRYRDSVDQTVGSVSVSWSQRAANIQGILGMLRMRLLASGAVLPYAGGISHTLVDAVNGDPDRVPPQMTVNDGHNNRRANDAPGIATGPYTGVYDP